jgi:hypothetical protein
MKLDVREFYAIWESGFFSSLNYMTGVNIDDAEDDAITVRNNPTFTEAQLADIWVREANNMMTTLSKGLGRVGRQASLNPAQPIVSRAYVPCN